LRGLIVGGVTLHVVVIVGDVQGLSVGGVTLHSVIIVGDIVKSNVLVSVV